MTEITIGNRVVGDGHPVYFIAEIGSNHEGRLEKAMHLCMLAKQAGANCTKFQHYSANKLASRVGFEQLTNLAHYTENPYDVFAKYEVPWDWTPKLKEFCDYIGIEFMSTPYDLESVDHLEPYVNAYKIGSGDITYKELIKKVVSKGKPIILSTGASSDADIDRALRMIPGDAPLALLQCNTNYSAVDVDNYKYLDLSVLYRFAADWNVVTGLSDHTNSYHVVTAAVALGAKIIERHFTDNRRTNLAPDSPFAMDPYDYTLMVENIRKVETVLGDGIKKVEENEKETVILQRRCVRAAELLTAGSTLEPKHLVCLRPAPLDCVPPYDIEKLVGRVLSHDIPAGDAVRFKDLV